MSLDAATRACPMCDATQVVTRIDVQRDGTRFHIVRCARCRFVFVANPRGQTFAPVQEQPPAVPERARHRQIKRICDGVLSPSTVTCRVVEIGAGWGGLAQVFAGDQRYRYLGFEPSASRAAFCRARGFDVREELFRGPDSVGMPVDAIIIDNVLEHVEHPAALARTAVDSLRAGGLLIVIVPNVRDVRQLLPRWRRRHHWRPHHHINYFSAHDLRRLFAHHGMQPHFFGLEALGALRDDLAFVPRMLADAIGLHPLGLNVYGVKPGTAVAGTHG